MNRAISYHLPIRNAASVHLDSNNSGACRPDHVYFRPPPPLASVHEDPGALRSHKRALSSLCVKITERKPVVFSFFAEMRM